MKKQKINSQSKALTSKVLCEARKQVKIAEKFTEKFKKARILDDSILRRQVTI